MQRVLKTLDQETTNASYSITGEYVAAPTGVLAVRSFVLNTNPRVPLEQMTSDMQSYAYNASGKPLFFETVGAQFRFAPVPDATYTATLVYLAKFTALTGADAERHAIAAENDRIRLHELGDAPCKHHVLQLLRRRLCCRS